jgi:chromosome segregation ATPase
MRMDLGRIRSKLGGWILVILVFGLGNLVLVGAQKLWYHSDQVKLDEVNSELETQHGRIAALELQVKKCSVEGKTCQQLADGYPGVISGRKRELETMERMRTHIRRLEKEVQTCSKADGGRCEAKYVEYFAAVKAYNAEVKSANAAVPHLKLVEHKLEGCERSVKECEEAYGEYSGEIDSYNAKVDEADALAKKIGTIWYVVPVPRFAGHGRVEE